LGLDAYTHGSAHAHHDDRPGGHAQEISCFAILREQPVHAVTLTLLLEVLAEHCGGDLLRLKGLGQRGREPDRPAVIHGVQHVFHPPAWLGSWPSEDRRTASFSSSGHRELIRRCGGAGGRGARGDAAWLRAGSLQMESTCLKYSVGAEA
jgi:G3E family GTPase